MIKRIMKKRTRTHKTIVQRNSAIYHAIAAFIGYGIWAFYANHEYGISMAASAAMLQGIYAFCATLCSAHIGHTMLKIYGYNTRGVIIGTGAAFLLMLCISVSIHAINKTPDIAQTILPGMIWGTFYMLFFLVALSKKHNTPD